MCIRDRLEADIPPAKIQPSIISECIVVVNISASAEKADIRQYVLVLLIFTEDILYL